MAALSLPPRPPCAPRRPDVRFHHGDRVDDPYTWLANRDDPAVIDYLASENAYAEQRTAHLEPAREQLFQERRARTALTDASVPVASGPWWYYSRIATDQQYPVHARAPIAPGARAQVPILEPGQHLPEEQVLVDENALAAGHDYCSVGILTVSPDHRWLAYGVDYSGDERFDITLVDLAEQRVRESVLRGVGYSAAWSWDASQLYYTRVDAAWRPYQVWRHQVSGEQLVLQEDDARFWLGVSSSRDERHIIISLASKDTTEVHLLDATQANPLPRCVAPREPGVEYEVEPAADHLLIVHNRRRPDAELAIAPLGATSHMQWQTVVTPEPQERLSGVDAFDEFAVLSGRSGAFSTLWLIPRVGAGRNGAPQYGQPVNLGSCGELSTLGIGENPDPAATTLRMVHESWISPPAVMELDVKTGQRRILKQQPVFGGVRLEDYVARLEWVLADDGTPIPLSIITRADVLPQRPSQPGAVQSPGLPMTGNAGWITGYGAYEVSSDPYFSVRRLSLLDREVVVAVAHVRGGGELGRAWYEQGRLERKNNSFTDFVACARHLIDGGWVGAGRLVAEGGSAGGLLVGAAANLAPELFAAVHAQVPFVDPLTTMLEPDLPLTIGEWEEWGNPLQDPAVYALMKGYSPYENVARCRYPAILATASLHDTRVLFTEAAKWVARLRERATNDPQHRPILLKTELAAGHAGASGRYREWRQAAWEDAVLLAAIRALDLGVG